jgi:starch-binding outer membrane protein, SusD/RagB family
MNRKFSKYTIMKKLQLITLLMLFVGLVMSCTDLLDTQPYGSVSDALFQNEEGVEALLVGAYGELIRAGGAATGGTPSNEMFGSMASDDAYKGSEETDLAQINDIVRWEVSTSNIHVREKWYYVFNGVSRTNEVLRMLNLARDNVSDNRAVQIEAEARFLRAFFNFEGYLVFKNIPIITEETPSPRDVGNTEDIIPHIIEDLRFAWENLPEVQSQPGRPTLFAAKAVAARAHLFDGDYDSAKVLLDQIINSGQFELMPHFFDNFRIDYNNNRESIFEIQLSVNDPEQRENGSIGTLYSFPQGGDIGTSSGFHQPSQNLVNAHKVDENGLPLFETFNDEDLKNDMGVSSSSTFVPFDDVVDPRLDFTVSRRGMPYRGWGVNRGNDWIRDQAFGGPYLPVPKQFFDFKHRHIYSSEVGRGSNANNFRYYRYGNVLMWRAEVAIAEGDLVYAEELVNKLRTRAGNEVLMGRVYTYELPVGMHEYDADGMVINWNEPAANYDVQPYPPGTFQSMGPEYALRAVQWETRLEFAMEGHRFFDLRRWGILEEVLNDFASNDTRIRPFMSGSRITLGRSEYMPIPQREIDLQPGVLTQNPGY